MARRLDRRVVRTRKLLREALMALILEEGYDAISIQDITDKANLGRATFYLHFKDKEELLLDVMDEFIADLLGQVPQLSEAYWRLEDLKPIIKLFDLAAEHYDLFRILTIGSGGNAANRQLHQSIANHIAATIQKVSDEKGTTPLIAPEFIANHFAGSLLSTIYWWLDNDLPFSVEEMADMFLKINQLDRKTLMGFDHKEARDRLQTKKDTKKKRGKEKSSVKKGEKETVPEKEELTIEVETLDSKNEMLLASEDLENTKE